LAALAAAIAVGAPATARAAPPQRSFDASSFAGLATPRIPADGDPALDYELDGAHGQVLRFTRCSQARAVPEVEVRADQFALWRLLQLNCRAAAAWAGARAARRSHFPPALTRTLVAALPADTVPDLGGSDRPGRAGRTLAQHEQQLHITVPRRGSARVRTRDGELSYTLLARADFDGDGLEDWLLRSEWSPREGAHGAAAELVLLSRRAAGAAITVIARP
jgi:hypothetical protein